MDRNATARNGLSEHEIIAFHALCSRYCCFCPNPPLTSRTVRGARRCPTPIGRPACARAGGRQGPHTLCIGRAQGRDLAVWLPAPLRLLPCLPHVARRAHARPRARPHRPSPDVRENGHATTRATPAHGKEHWGGTWQDSCCPLTIARRPRARARAVAHRPAPVRRPTCARTGTQQRGQRPHM